jgi:hypothetical protein
MRDCRDNGGVVLWRVADLRITKDMRKALDALIPAEHDLQGRWFTLAYAARKAGFGYNDFLTVLGQLEDNGLAKYGDAQKSCFLLTHYGEKYKELRSMELKDVWRERVIGFLSGAVLTCLAWWLSLL